MLQEIEYFEGVSITHFQEVYGNQYCGLPLTIIEFNLFH